MAELCLEDDDYYWITRLAMDVARRHCQGRVVSVLEGGYCLEALARSTEAHVKALAGLPMEDGISLRHSPPAAHASPKVHARPDERDHPLF